MSNTTTPPPFIALVKCIGHNDAITCLDYCGSYRDDSSCSGTVVDSSLLSGSEDKTCRLWDLRTLRTSICIRCPAEVMSVSYGPSAVSAFRNRVENGTDDRFSEPYIVYAAVENAVLGYDLRNVSTPIIADASVLVTQSTDEVNQILFSTRQGPMRKFASRKGANKKKNRKSTRHSVTSTKVSPVDRDLSEGDCNSTNPPHVFVAADDTGVLRIRYLFDGEVSMESTEKIFHHGTDEAPSMVTAIACSRQSDAKSRSDSNLAHNLLASGGTDCTVKLWDVSAKHESLPLQSFSIPASDSGTKQLCNPPMVHYLSWSSSGRLLAAALGDGSVALWQQTSTGDASNSCNVSLVMTARLDEAHSGPVAACIFPEWASSSSCNSRPDNDGKYSKQRLEVHDRLLCTAGNDGCVVLWDLGESIAGEKAIRPDSYLMSTTTDHSLKKLQNLTLNDSLDGMDGIDQPKTLFALSHATKPNWMISSRRDDFLFPTALFLADTTNDITIYSIPTG